MRTTNTFGIQFIIRKNKAKEELAPIYVRITVDSRRVEISLKRWINPNDWDNIKGKAKGNKEEARSLNHYLEEVRAQLVQNYQELQLQKQLITSDTIKNMFLGLDEKEYTLCKLVEYHNQVMMSTLTWGTMKNYFTTQKYIHKFLKEKCRTTDVFLASLSYKFIIDFEFYLRNYQPIDHHKQYWSALK